MGQRFFDFVGSLLGWGIVAALYDEDNAGASRLRLPDDDDDDDDFEEDPDADAFINNLSEDDLALLVDLERNQPGVVKRLSGSGSDLPLSTIEQRLQQRQRENQHILRPVSFEFREI